MGKFARQICNKFTGVQILCKSRWKFARVQINMQIYGKFNPCKFNICAEANYRQILLPSDNRLDHGYSLSGMALFSDPNSGLENDFCYPIPSYNFMNDRAIIDFHMISSYVNFKFCFPRLNVLA